ncbi:UNVERIFIED_CONTAM: hypothetical protein N8J90_14780 [Halobacillus marinus]|uniref:hypothetical protein n=1 Tax=Halobacillus sp. BAB-2008 TaxID=1246484 RepID=UPI0003050EE5|nr:hypothetical protein [Halobacillus sp. BAB-2008]
MGEMGRNIVIILLVIGGWAAVILRDFPGAKAKAGGSKSLVILAVLCSALLIWIGMSL